MKRDKMDFADELVVETNNLIIKNKRLEELNKDLLEACKAALAKLQYNDALCKPNVEEILEQAIQKAEGRKDECNL